LGATVSAALLPGKGTSPISVDFPILDFSGGQWAVFLLVTLLALTASSLLAWAVQSAMIRAADAAADGKPISSLDALRLGRRRWESLLKLAVTFGVVIQALGILPALIALFLQKNTAWGAAAAPLMQTFLAPLNLVLGILVFLLMMSIALEEARPRAALRRIADLVRSAWWGFLLAYIVQAILALAIALVFAFLLALTGFLFLTPLWIDSPVGAEIGAAICLLASPVGLILIAFTLVFSTVYFTLTYRAARGDEIGMPAVSGEV
jgi:hypothetical protein